MSPIRGAFVRRELLILGIAMACGLSWCPS